MGQENKSSDTLPLVRPIHAVKVTPSFQTFQTFRFTGGNLHFSSALRWPRITLDVSLRYFRGLDTTVIPKDFEYEIPRHYRLDIEPRFWFFDRYNKLSMGAVFSVYHTGKLAGGLSFYYMIPLTFKGNAKTQDSYFFLEPGTGFYTTSIEKFSNNTPLYLRYILSIGYYWNSTNTPR